MKPTKKNQVTKLVELILQEYTLNGKQLSAKTITCTYNFARCQAIVNSLLLMLVNLGYLTREACVVPPHNRYFYIYSPSNKIKKGLTDVLYAELAKITLGGYLRTRTNKRKRVNKKRKAPLTEFAKTLPSSTQSPLQRLIALAKERDIIDAQIKAIALTL